MDFPSWPRPGNRIVVSVHSYAGVTSVPFGFELHAWTSNTLGVRLYSKIATGSEGGFSVSLSDPTNRIHMYMAEHSDAEEVVDVYTGMASGSVSAGFTNLRPGSVVVSAVSVYRVGTSGAGITWPWSLSQITNYTTSWADSGQGKMVRSSHARATGQSGSWYLNDDLVDGANSYAWVLAAFGPRPDETPPTVPENLRLTGMTPTSVSVAWDASTDNEGVAGYETFLGGESKGTTSGRSATLSGLASGVPVVVGVEAYDAEGNRSGRAELTVTPINDTTPPEAPVVRPTALGAGTITVGWDVPYDDSRVTGYGIYLNGVKQGTDQAGTTKVFTGLAAGALYTVEVDAVDLLGNQSARGARTLRAQPDTSPPSLPGDVHVVAPTKTSATIAWEPSADDNSGVARYGLYLGSLRIAEIPSLVFTFTGLTPGITYNLGVDAVDWLGNRTGVVRLSVATLPDTSGAAPPYEYVFYDWHSHLPLDSLPLQKVSFEITLGGGGTLTAEIPLYDVAYNVGRVAAATRPERTMLLVYRGERLVWGGRVVDPQDYDSESGVLRISAEEVVGIYGRRFVAFTGPRAATLAHSELVWLLEHAATPADLRWLTHEGVPGLVPVDREYRAEEFPRILERAEEVAAAPGGFEWWTKPSWDALNDRPRFELRRVSRDTPPDTGLTLEYPGNVRRYRRSTRRGLETRTWGKLSKPDGGVLLSSTTRNDLLAEGWPLVEEAYQFDGLTSQAALDAETARASAAASGAKQVFEFDLAIGADVRWWEWELGGMVQAVIVDHLYPGLPDGTPGLDRDMKFVALRVQPDSDEGELVTLVTGEHTVAAD